MPSHFGLPARQDTDTVSVDSGPWAAISAVIGIITVSLYLGGTTPSALEPKFQNLWYGFGVFSPETYAKLPNSLVIVTLVSNFGTFMLYMMTCIVAMVAFREHKSFNGSNTCSSRCSGLGGANLICMLFYPWCVRHSWWRA